MTQNKIKSFRDLSVWQKSADLAVLVYKVTEHFPQPELYGLVSQMRRAAVSISSNIAEGFKRSYKKEKIQFYNMAYGSASELESQVEVSKKLRFINVEEYQKLLDLLTEVSKMLTSLIRSTNANFPKSYILNSIFFLLLLSATFYILNPIPVLAAEFSVSTGTQHLRVGDEAQLEVLLDTEGEQLNAFEGSLAAPDMLEITGVRDGGSVAPLWVEAPRLVAHNVVPFSGVIPGGYAGKGVVLFSLTARAVREGAGAVTFSGLRALLNDGRGTATPASASPLQLTVLGTTAAPVALTFKDTVPPEPFSVALTRDPNVFAGRWFAVFVAQDKGSGLDHYEVAEVEGSPVASSSALPWQEARRPYPLLDQTRQSTLYVRAIDRAGNVRVAVVPAAVHPWYRNLGVWSIVGVGVLVLVAMLMALIFARRYAKKPRGF